MKKKYYILVLLVLFLLPFKVYASGGFSVSKSSISMYLGETKTITIYSDNAVGKLNISSSKSGVASVNTGSVFIQTPGASQKITITSKSVGTATISVVASDNFATMDEEILSGKTKTITVKVIAKPTQKPNSESPKQPQNNLSKNNNIKNLSVEGYELVKVNNNNYTLTVSNYVTSVNVNATAEDTKAKVSGTGVKELQVGENNIEVIVTSESGIQNKINIKVTRKDGYYIEDIESVLQDDKLQEADIIISDDTKLSVEDINKIKESKKNLRLNYYDENKKLIYSWIINGEEIKDSKEFSTFIAFTTEHVKEIYKLSNYADGMYIKFDYEGDLPKGIKIRLYTEDKFENESTINLYHYNKTEKVLNLIKDDLIVKDGYIELDLEYASDYFVTMSTIGSSTNEEAPVKNALLIYSITATIIIIGLVVFIVIKLRSNNKSN